MTKTFSIKLHRTQLCSSVDGCKEQFTPKHMTECIRLSSHHIKGNVSRYS